MFSKLLSDPRAAAHRRWQADSLRRVGKHFGAEERIAAAQAKRDRKNAKRAAIVARQQEAA